MKLNIITSNLPNVLTSHAILHRMPTHKEPTWEKYSRLSRRSTPSVLGGAEVSASAAGALGAVSSCASS